MKKPILLNRYKKMDSVSRKIVIGVIGVEKGVGVTHTSLLIASYFSKWLGQKTIYIEWEQNEIKELNDGESNRFNKYGIWFYGHVCDNKMSQIIGSEYKCAIIDFGVQYQKARNEFLRCDIKIVVANPSPWKRSIIKKFIESTKEDYQENWMYFLFCTSRKEFNLLKRDLPVTIIGSPLLANPFSLSQESVVLFQKIFNYYEKEWK